MKNVLISAYACEPFAGSEYGVGWYVPTLMAKQYPQLDFFVLTRSRCRDKIERVMKEQPIGNLHFLFYDIPSWIYYKNEMQSNWGEQLNYLVWQLMVRRFVKKQHKKIHFDVFHHLTFNQYRTPSPGFFLDIPFVMGPVGGAEFINTAFYKDLNEVTRNKENIRRKGRDYILFRWLVNRKKNKKCFLFSSEGNRKRLSPLCKDYDVKVIPAIGFTPDDFDVDVNHEITNAKFTMLYAGKALDWKGIHIFLKAAAQGLVGNNKNDFTIKLVGIRFEDEQKMVKAWIRELGLTEYVELIPFIQRSDLLKLLKDVNVSIYPAFRDSGSMSVLESCALGCPTICFNAGGQDAFPNDILLKIQVEDSYESNVDSFAEKLLWAYNHPADIANIGAKAKEYVYEKLTWEYKINQFYNIYKELIG